jgi:hypothetical protein
VVQFSFPLFTLIFPDRETIIDLTVGETMMIPMFSSDEDARLYIERAHLACRIMALPTPAYAKRILISTHTPDFKPLKDYRIVFDPIGPDASEFRTISREQFLEACESVL